MKLEIANVWIELDATLKSNVKKENITPPQALMLRKMFGKKVVGEAGARGWTNPFVHLEVVGEVETTTAAEYSRLTGIFGEKMVEEAFPGENPTFPPTFAEIGLEETSEANPKEGKKHSIEPIASVKKGDLNDAEKAELAARDPLQAALLKQQEQITALTASVSGLVAALAALAPPKPAVAPQQEQQTPDSSAVNE